MHTQIPNKSLCYVFYVQVPIMVNSGGTKQPNMTSLLLQDIIQVTRHVVNGHILKKKTIESVS